MTRIRTGQRSLAWIFFIGALALGCGRVARTQTKAVEHEARDTQVNDRIRRVERSPSASRAQPEHAATDADPGDERLRAGASLAVDEYRALAGTYRGQPGELQAMVRDGALWTTRSWSPGSARELVPASREHFCYRENGFALRFIWNDDGAVTAVEGGGSRLVKVECQVR